MRFIVKRFIVIIFITLILPAMALASRGIEVRAKLESDSGKTIGTYRALIIGIDDYQDNAIPDLDTAVNDAREVAEILQRDYGFSDVRLLLNQEANATGIIGEMERLVAESKENDSILIYYAGHGVLNKTTKKGYWIPVNASVRDRSSHISNSIIQDYIEVIPARHVLLVADSCFSGSLFGTGRSFPPINDKFFSSVYRDKSRWGMTSGNLTPVADSGSGGHSIFAYHFLKMLRENENPYITPMQIYDRIGPIVANNSEQRPVAKPIRNTGDEGGLFVFIRTASLTPKPSSVPASEWPIQVPSEPAPVVLRGHLQINVNATNSKVTINGESIGTADPSKPLSLRNLSTGRMSVRVDAKGFEPMQKTVTISRNQWTQEVFELSRTKVAGLEPPKQPSSPKIKSSGNCPQKMSFIPGGVFMAGKVGSLKDMSLNALCMDQYEVTQAEYERVMGNNPSHFRGRSRPVERVTWHNAKMYCKKVGKRLPTEWEWEKAAKAGTSTKYYWGYEDKDDYAWYDANSDNKTHSVGEKKPNPFGLYDMSGNVWEWTNSDYDEHGKYKVLRGGSWYNNPNSLRSAYRLGFGPSGQNLTFGFRCAQ